MRRWVKVTLSIVALVALGMLALAGTGAYFVFRSLERRPATEAQTLNELEQVRARFGTRPPLVEIVDPRSGDVRINRLQSTDGRRVSTIHVIAWKAADRELTRTHVPLWLMQFSSINLLSRLGLGPARLRLTVDDIQRYGQGIIVDFRGPGSDRALIWVD
jgi:hypothetical protein